MKELDPLTVSSLLIVNNCKHIDHFTFSLLSNSVNFMKKQKQQAMSLLR